MGAGVLRYVPHGTILPSSLRTWENVQTVKLSTELTITEITNHRIVNGPLRLNNNSIGGFVKKARSKKPKLYGLRQYWPHLSHQEAEIERQKLSDNQNGCCAICKKPESSFKMRLSVDHNHKTGQVRGLLCYRCNKFVVGRNTYESATKIVEYLKVEVGYVPKL